VARWEHMFFFFSFSFVLFFWEFWFPFGPSQFWEDVKSKYTAKQLCMWDRELHDPILERFERLGLLSKVTTKTSILITLIILKDWKDLKSYSYGALDSKVGCHFEHFLEARSQLVQQRYGDLGEYCNIRLSRTGGLEVKYRSRILSAFVYIWKGRTFHLVLLSAPNILRDVYYNNRKHSTNKTSSSIRLLWSSAKLFSYTT
jgi:hypothetical protein